MKPRRGFCGCALRLLHWGERRRLDDAWGPRGEGPRSQGAKGPRVFPWSADVEPAGPRPGLAVGSLCQDPALIAQPYPLSPIPYPLPPQDAKHSKQKRLGRAASFVLATLVLVGAARAEDLPSGKSEDPAGGDAYGPFLPEKEENTAGREAPSGIEDRRLFTDLVEEAGTDVRALPDSDWDPILAVLGWLGVVMVALVVFLWILRKGLRRSGILHGNDAVRLLGRLPLSPRQSVHFLKVANRVLVVGSVAEGLVPLGEVTDEKGVDLLVAGAPMEKATSVARTFGRFLKEETRRDSGQEEEDRAEALPESKVSYRSVEAEIQNLRELLADWKEQGDWPLASGR